MAASLFGPIILALFPLAGSANDLVSLIDAADYFQSRQIEIRADRLVELAARKADGSADRVAQLLAIRWLAENPGELKKVQNGRQTLQQLADGKLGQDPQGFVKAYATRALLRLDGKKPVLAVIGDDGLKETLSWFPDGVTSCYAMDVRTRHKEPLLDEAAIVSTVRKFMGKVEREKIYNLADTIGNVRVDGLSVGMTLDPNGRPDTIYIRVTGLADRELLAKFIFVQSPNTNRVEEKGPKGEPITLLEMGDREPAIALVGDTDMIIAGKSRPMKDSLPIVRTALSVRAGKQASAVKGSLAPVLKGMAAGASVLVGGDLPNELKGLLVQPGGPLPAFPRDALVTVVGGPTIDFRLTGKLASAEEAKAFADAAATMKEKGLAALKEPAIPLPEEAATTLRKALLSVQAEADGDRIQVTGQLNPAGLQALTQSLFSR